MIISIHETLKSIKVIGGLNRVTERSQMMKTKHNQYNKEKAANEKRNLFGENEYVEQ